MSQQIYLAKIILLSQPNRSIVDMGHIPGQGYRGRDGSQVEMPDSGLVTDRTQFRAGRAFASQA